MSLPISLTTSKPGASRSVELAQLQMPKPQTRQELLSRVAERLIANVGETLRPPYHMYYTGVRIQAEINAIMGDARSPIKRPLNDCFVINTSEHHFLLELKMKVLLGNGHHSQVYAASLYSTAGKVLAALKMPLIKSKEDIGKVNKRNLREHVNLLALQRCGAGVQKPAYALLTNIPMQWQDPETGIYSIIYVSAPLHYYYDCTIIDLFDPQNSQHREWRANHFPFKKRKQMAFQVLQQVVRLIKEGRGHGDIKLENLLVENIEKENSTVVISDLADSWFPSKDMEQTAYGLRVKTKGYISPEDLDQQRYLNNKISKIKKDRNPQSEFDKLKPLIRAHYNSRDIASTGITLYGVLTGYTPYYTAEDIHIPLNIKYDGESIHIALQSLDPVGYAEESTQALLRLIDQMCYLKAIGRAELTDIESFLIKYAP